MNVITAGSFDTTAFLGAVGAGRTIQSYKKDTTVFSQGDSAGSVYFIQRGKVKLAIVSSRGKSAVLGIIGTGLFFGEGCLTGQPLRMTTATAFTECTIVEVQKTTMMRVIKDEPTFAASFITHLLTRNLRIEEDLIDHLFNPSEKRLARILLLLANYGKESRSEQVIADISQGTLAEMIGTTRPRVNYFLKKFERLGFIEYDGGLHVKSALLNVILGD
jgi:CRP/FNR family cyclic AMP-dependent transcriptional regulator